MTTGEAIKYATGSLEKLYDAGEASAITDLLMERITGSWGPTLKARSGETLDAPQLAVLDGFIKRLQQAEPVQYVLGEAWFAGLKLYVEPAVLIPRPETEELVAWIVADRKYRPDGTTLLDIGTGSGCIPLALKKKLANLHVDAIDVSKAALAVAGRNATDLGLPINFRQLDFLSTPEWENLGMYDLIVSNPPYIPASDISDMHGNVKDHEPATALFVPDTDPLLFYRNIALFSTTHLKPDGAVYVEIYEGLGNETVELFSEAGFDVVLKQDMQGKDRMIRARTTLH